MLRLLDGLLAALRAERADAQLGANDVAALRHAGVLRSETRFADGKIVSPDGARIGADLGRRAHPRRAGARMPGTRAAGRHGHACRLPARAARRSMPRSRALAESERRLFDMRGVGFINQLYGDDFELRDRAALARALREHHDDADDARRRGVGRPRRRPRGLRRRRPVQLRRDGARTARRALGAVRARPRAARTASSSRTSSRVTATSRSRATCATSRSPSTASRTCAAAPMPNASPR